MKVRIVKQVYLTSEVRFVPGLVVQAEMREDGHMWVLGYDQPLLEDEWRYELKNTEVLAFFIHESNKQRKKKED